MYIFYAFQEYGLLKGLTVKIQTIKIWRRILSTFNFPIVIILF